MNELALFAGAGGGILGGHMETAAYHTLDETLGEVKP